MEMFVTLLQKRSTGSTRVFYLKPHLELHVFLKGRGHSGYYLDKWGTNIDWTNVEINIGTKVDRGGQTSTKILVIG